jgi:hypothetical protein
MEILRFEDSTSPAPKRKKSSKGYITLGFVAAVFGIGSAFATTTSSINVNNGQNIALGQGITTFVTCDEFIAILPVTKLNGDATNFVLDKVIVGAEYALDEEYKINAVGKEADPAGCGGVEFKITFYKSNIKANVCMGKGFETVVGASAPRCEESSIFFTVVTDTESYDIQFDDSVGTGFFDRISLETV